VRKQLQAFKTNFGGVDLRFAKRKNLTAYDVLIIASMIEREAMLPRERPLIASVIYNRLRKGTPLGIDSTIRFATGNWDHPLTGDDGRRLRGARPRLALREAAGPARALRRDGARAAGVGLPRRERHDPAQAGGPRASRPPDRGRRRDRGGQHAHLRERRDR